MMYFKFLVFSNFIYLIFIPKPLYETEREGGRREGEEEVDENNRNFKKAL